MVATAITVTLTIFILIMITLIIKMMIILFLLLLITIITLIITNQHASRRKLPTRSYKDSITTLTGVKDGDEAHLLQPPVLPVAEKTHRFRVQFLWFLYIVP